MTVVARARARASRRKSPWNLLLIPAVAGSLAVICSAFVSLAQVAHGFWFADQSLRQARGFGPILTTVGSVLAALPLALLAGNVLVWFVTPARRALDREATPYPAASFRESQRALLRASLFVITPSLLLAAIGVLLSWR